MFEMKLFRCVVPVFLLLTLAQSAEVIKSQKNECHNTYRNEKGYTQDYIKISKTDKRLCCLCNKGTFMKHPCNATDKTSTVCQACPTGTYMDQAAHSHRACKTNPPISCPSDEIPFFSPISVPRCICTNGSFKISDICQDWKTCPSGYGINKPGVHKKCLLEFDLLTNLNDLNSLLDNPSSNLTNSSMIGKKFDVECNYIFWQGVVVGMVIVLLPALLIFIGIKCGCLTWNGSKKQHRQNNRKDSVSGVSSPNVSGEDNDIGSQEEMLGAVRVKSNNEASNQG